LALTGAVSMPAQAQSQPVPIFAGRTCCGNVAILRIRREYLWRALAGLIPKPMNSLEKARTALFCRSEISKTPLCPGAGPSGGVGSNPGKLPYLVTTAGMASRRRLCRPESRNRQTKVGLVPWSTGWSNSLGHKWRRRYDRRLVQVRCPEYRGLGCRGFVMYAQGFGVGAVRDYEGAEASCREA